MFKFSLIEAEGLPYAITSSVNRNYMHCLVIWAPCSDQKRLLPVHVELRNHFDKDVPFWDVVLTHLGINQPRWVSHFLFRFDKGQQMSVRQL